MTIKRLQNYFVSLSLLFSLALNSLGLWSNPFSKVLLGHDSSMFYYFGRGMSDGLVPYREMFDHKGPFLFLIEFFAVNLHLGTTGLWLIEIVFLAWAYFYIYRTALLLTENEVASALIFPMTVGLFLHLYEGGNLSEEYAVAFVSNTLYLFCKLFLRGKLHTFEYILIGVLGSLTFFLRGNMIALWGVFCLALLIIGTNQKKYHELKKQAGWIFFDGLIVVLVIVIYCWMIGNLNEMLQQAFVMNIKYSATTWNDRFQMIRFFMEILIPYGLLALLALAWITMMTDKAPWEQKHLYVVLSIYFLANYYTVVLSGRPYLHYLVTQLPIILLFLAILLATLLKKAKSSVIAFFICLLLLMIPALATKRDIQNKVLVTNRGTEEINQNVKQEKDLADYIKRHSTVNDKIYVHNLGANLYLLSNRYANSRFFVLPAVDYTKFPKLQSEFRDALNSSPPKFIVVKRVVLDQPVTDSNLDQTVLKTLQMKYRPINQFQRQEQVLFQKN